MRSRLWDGIKKPFLVLLLLATSLAGQQTGNFLPKEILPPRTHEPSTVCRAAGVKGFESSQESGHAWVGNVKTTLSGLKLYISVENEKLWVQSNFVTRGFQFPTKIVTNTHPDLASVLFNIVGKEEDSGISEYELFETASNVPIFVNETLFRSDYKDFDFGDAKNVQVVCSDNRPRPSRPIDSQNSEVRFRRIVEYYPDLYSVAGDSTAPTIFKRMETEAFPRGDVRLMSLVSNTATEKAFSKLIPDKNRVVANDFSDSSVFEAIKGQKGGILFILGHVDTKEDVIVATNASGKELTRLPIQDLQKVGKANEVQVFILGCNSARTGNHGVASTFNSIDAITRFASALSASTWITFYRAMAAPKLQLVLDSSSFTTNGAPSPARKHVQLVMRKDGTVAVKTKDLFPEVETGEGSARITFIESTGGATRSVGTVVHSFKQIPIAVPNVPMDGNLFTPDTRSHWFDDLIFFGILGTISAWVIAKAVKWVKQLVK